MAEVLSNFGWHYDLKIHCPLAIGFCLWFTAPLMLFSLDWALADRYPYSFPILLSEMSEMETKPNVPLIQILSNAYGMFLLGLAFIEFMYCG